MKICSLIFIIMISYNSIFAEEFENEFGFSVGVQELQIDLNLPIFITQHLALVPSFGITNISDKYTDIIIGNSVRYYFNRKKLAPYSGARLGALIYIPNNSDTVTDYITGIFFGSEYYIDNNLSVGGELQLNLSLSDKDSNRFGNPDGTIINTGSLLFVTFYFN